MTVEEFYVDYLSEMLDVPVSGDIPSPMPSQFVTLEQTGSNFSNHIYQPALAVQSWAESRAEAANLNEQVKAAMAASVSRPEIGRCHLDTDYNHPDLETLKPRYQAEFEIVYLN